jgi:hydroxyacylglutathione hydrolase
VKISDRVFLAGSGYLGCSLTHECDCNVYAVDCGGECAIVDAGCGIEPRLILENLARDGIRAGTLLLTHGHLDHSGGARFLRDELGIRVSASALTACALEAGDEDAIGLRAAKRAGIYPSDTVFRACPVDRVLAGGDRLEIGDSTVEVLATPGHSRDMLAFLVRSPAGSALFSGDTVFHGGRIALQDIPDCDVPAYTASLRCLAGCDAEGLYPGHLVWSVRDGRRHLRAAAAYLERMLLPPSII